jgi:hypothetical protein
MNEDSDLGQITATMPGWMRNAIQAHRTITGESLSSLVRRGLVSLVEKDRQWDAVLTAYQPSIGEVAPPKTPAAVVNHE